MTHKEQFLKQCMVLDTETTSNDYKVAEIIESGFVTRSKDTWTVFQELHAPTNGTIPAKIQSICYITNDMVKGKPPFVNSNQVFQNVVNQFKSGYLIAHNHFYDMRVLESHGVDTREFNWICTWRMAKKIFGDAVGIEETNLPYLRFALELDVPIDMYCHRAGNDAFITAKLLEVMIDYMEMTGLIDKDLPYGPQVHEFANSAIIYKTMPFGKHRGQLMTTVPMSYWKWAMDNTHWFDESADNFDPDLMASINMAISESH